MTIQHNEKKTVSGTVCKMYVEHDGLCTWGTSCKFDHPLKQACKDKQKTKSKAPNKANTNNNKKKKPQHCAVPEKDNVQPDSYNITTGHCIGDPYMHMFNTYGIVYGYIPQPFTKKQNDLPKVYDVEENAKGDKPNLREAFKRNNPTIAAKFVSASKSAAASPVTFGEMPANVSKRSVSAPPVIGADKLTNQELYNAVHNATTCEQAIAMVSSVSGMTFVPAYYSHVQRFLTSGKNAVHALESMWLYDLISVHVRHAIINANNLQRLVSHCVETIQSYRRGLTTNATSVCHAVACIKAVSDFYGTTYQF
jgi:hypothetical protein